MTHRLKRALSGLAAIGLAAALVSVAGPAHAAPGLQPAPVLNPDPVSSATSSFALATTPTAACDGTGSTGWRAHTFIVNDEVDVSTLDFSVSGLPVGWVGQDFDSTDGTLAAPLFKTSSAAVSFIPANSPAGQINPSAPTGFNFSSSAWNLADGEYKNGLACVDPATTLQQWWTLEVFIDAGAVAPNPLMTTDLPVPPPGTVVGSCTGQVLLATFFDAVSKAATTLGDQTVANIGLKTKLLKDQTTKQAIAGDCSAAVRPGDPIHPAGGLVSPLTPKAVAGKLIGNAGCASGAGIPADANAAAQWPLSGKVTWTMTQANDLVKPYQIQAQVSIRGFDPVQADVVNLGGLVLKGAAVGASVSGSLWQDPVALTGGPTGYNTGYELDLAQAAGCANGTPGDASISSVLIGGGAGSATSLLGSNADGVIFTVGQ
jgi:hypothetical protein